MIIALISQKGGVGKSTLARILAVEFTRNQWNAKIADLDPAQGTSTQWKIRRDAQNHSPDISVQKYRNTEAALKDSPTVDLMILDGPAHADKSAHAMAQPSNLVILPTGYSLDDLEPQVSVAYALEDAGIPSEKIRFAFVRAKGTETEDSDARLFLKRAGNYTALTATLPELRSIRQAHTTGLAASEVPYTTVRERAEAIVLEVNADLMKGNLA